MDFLKKAIDLFLHVDKNLVVLVNQFGWWSYGILFAVIFMETGLVVTPFLPGDSLLFAAGALAAMGSFSIWVLYVLMVVAAVLGDTVNYWIGHFLGEEVFNKNHPLLKREYLTEAQHFYDKHGGKAILLARFVPIVRTFAPFVAGVGKMSYGKFIFYNMLGGWIWVSLFTLAGYWFGNIPLVKNNFHYVVVVIVLISVVPILMEVVKKKRKKAE